VLEGAHLPPVVVRCQVDLAQLGQHGLEARARRHRQQLVPQQLRRPAEGQRGVGVGNQPAFLPSDGWGLGRGAS
jgi:hypothetical protein